MLMSGVTYKLSIEDSAFLSHLRGIAIIVIVFGHIGGFWAFKPYSEFLHVFVPVFFFLSGSVSLLSFNKSKSVFHYYNKRFVGLLTPYFLLCILSLFVYLFQQGRFASLDWHYLSLWLQIRPPGKAVTPFPVGHVWFLHTLFIIILISPVYFYFYKNKIILFILLLIALLIAGTQSIYDIENSFYFFGNNIFKPIVHSSFFIFGFMYFSIPQLRNRNLILGLFTCSILLNIVLVRLLELNIDYEFHTFAPDLYYVAGSFATIFLFLLTKRPLVRTIKRFPLLERLSFFHYHTFSIYLLHVPVIFLFNKLFMPENSQLKDMKYAVLKLIFVLIVTCIFAIPFTYL